MHLHVLIFGKESLAFVLFLSFLFWVEDGRTPNFHTTHGKNDVENLIGGPISSWAPPAWVLSMYTCLG